MEKIATEVVKKIEEEDLVEMSEVRSSLEADAKHRIEQILNNNHQYYSVCESTFAHYTQEVINTQLKQVELANLEREKWLKEALAPTENFNPFEKCYEIIKKIDEAGASNPSRLEAVSETFLEQKRDFDKKFTERLEAEFTRNIDEFIKQLEAASTEFKDYLFKRITSWIVVCSDIERATIILQRQKNRRRQVKDWSVAKEVEFQEILHSKRIDDAKILSMFMALRTKLEE
jgi:hypothetical protein